MQFKLSPRVALNLCDSYLEALQPRRQVPEQTLILSVLNKKTSVMSDTDIKSILCRQLKLQLFQHSKYLKKNIILHCQSWAGFRIQIYFLRNFTVNIGGLKCTNKIRSSGDKYATSSLFNVRNPHIIFCLKILKSLTSYICSYYVDRPNGSRFPKRYYLSVFEMAKSTCHLPLIFQVLEQPNCDMKFV